MTTIAILNIISTIYVIYRGIYETYLLVEGIDKKEYIYGNKLHSLQHISIMLGGGIISLLLAFTSLECFGIVIFNLYFILFVLPHFQFERRGELNDI